MAPDNHAEPLRNGGQLSLPSPSNAIVASSDRPIRLENALKAFRDVLTDEERERLRDEMAVSRDAGQVIAFTASLDLVDPYRRGRSIATRLHSILQTVLQFSQVVDTYVSSHPEIAALVWGSVRLAFTVLANFTSFFQSFSDLLNGFDTLTPQFNEYQVLFPDSLPLRNSVYDFHSAIISCCTQVIFLTRRTWPQQAWASLTSSFESEIRPRVAEIREKAKLVKRQAVLAKAQDDSHRQASLAAELQRREKERKWNSLLLKLSSYDHVSAFTQARSKIHRGTAEWVFSTSEFRGWHDSTGSRVLNISGKIGSGKTIVAANVVSYLMQKAPANCSVSYLFVRFDDENSRLADMILRSLIFQALSGREVQDSLQELLEKSVSSHFERSSLLSLLNHSISLLEHTFLVVDGLDQCSPEEQDTLLQLFSRLFKSRNDGAVKIFISVRESMKEEVDRVLKTTEHLRIGLADTNADLARYAEEILAERRDQRRLVVGDEMIMHEILDKLRIGGEGMFLWVFLTIEDICYCPTDKDIRQTLETLPRKLSDTFNRALERILSSKPPAIVDLVQGTFKWVATVRRPITQWELGEALGVKILQKSWAKDQIIHEPERLPGWCENLVQIEAADETVRFFHHSIKTHLLDTKLKDKITDLAAFHVDLEAWDHQVGEICLTYLNFSDFDRALTKTSPATKDLDVSVRQIAWSDEGRRIPSAVGNQAILNAWPDTGRHTATRFLRRFLKTTKFGEGLRVPRNVSESAESPSEGDLGLSEFFSAYPFLLYATNFWFSHTFRFDQATTKTWSLWKHQVTKSMLGDDEAWADLGQQPPGFETFDPERWLADNNNVSDAYKWNKKLYAEWIAVHKAVIFADSIAHGPLLDLLTSLRDYGELNPSILEHLLPSRGVFQFPRERKGCIQYENAHDGLVSLVTEFIAWGGRLWPLTRPHSLQSSCDDACDAKPLHADMINVLCRTGYSRVDAPSLQLFAKIAVLKLTKEASDAIETWVNSKKPCIHEVKTDLNQDIIDIILAIGGPSSTKFARRVLDLHEDCVRHDGYRSNATMWRRKLIDAIYARDMIAIEFYLQESKTYPWKDGKEYRQIDDDLLRTVHSSWPLPPELRSQVISMAIPGVPKEAQQTTYDKFIGFMIAGNWEVAVALSRHLKLASMVPSDDRKASWFHVLDDVLCCVSQPETPSCTQEWLTSERKAKTTLKLCSRHTAEAKKAWSEPYPPGENYEDRLIFQFLDNLLYPATIQHL